MLIAMRSITCGTSLQSRGTIEVFDFQRIRLSDIKRMENYAQCFHRIHVQDDAFQGGITGVGTINTSRRATCALINQFLGPWILERSDTMRSGFSRS